MTTLDSPAVRAVLDDLYAQAEDNDNRVLKDLHAQVAASGRPFDDREHEELLGQAFMTMAPEVGRLIYLLARSRRPGLAVEFGTSFGLSAIHIAAALKDNGRGRLIATEKNPGKAARAAENIRRAGLADWAEVRAGDAFQTLSGVSGVEFLLLDGWKALYLPMLRQLEPGLAPGALIAADDLAVMPEMLKPYLDYVRDPAHGYVSCELPMDDGLELSWRE